MRICPTHPVLSLAEKPADTAPSWDLGTCVPHKIFGVRGLVPRMHPSLRSLSLTINSTCRYSMASQVDLSPFRELRHLRWRAPSAHHLDALSSAIRQNAAHLESLDLDFVRWRRLWRDLCDDEDTDAFDAGTERRYFSDQVLRLDGHSPRPLFPVIRVLSLSQVPLSPELARAINVDALECLTLRMCPAWGDFLSELAGPHTRVRLNTLEIQSSAGQADTAESADALRSFLASFQGLRELAIWTPGPLGTLQLWDVVARHHATLRRFVYHQRVDCANIRMEQDLPDLGVRRRALESIRIDPAENPLAQLDLEFVGLACAPKRLVSSAALRR